MNNPFDINDCYMRWFSEPEADIIEDYRDWHAVVTITLGELLEAGVPVYQQCRALREPAPQAFLTGNMWHTLATKVYENPTHEQVLEVFKQTVGYIAQRISDYYWYNETCDPVAKKFIGFLDKHIQANLNQLIYFIIREADGLPIDPFKANATTNDGHEIRERNVHSEYPQSQIKGEQDYADNADDRLVSDIHNVTNTGIVDELDRYVRFLEGYEDPFVFFLNKLSICFSETLSAGV